MAFSENWPFRRLMVDHLFHGTSRVWWELAPSFSDAPPRTFQLQAGYTGQSAALDWVSIGSPANDVLYLEDDSLREPAGKLILTHYRVLVTTAVNTYVSEPVPVWGLLEKRDWLIAREIVRKERLRLNLTGVDCYLLKRFRYGVLNQNNTDELTNEVIDSYHPESKGTPFKVGYHPPVPLTLDSTLWAHDETRGGGAQNPAKHSGLQVQIAPRILAAPFLHDEDILVDARTDQRYAVESVKVTASWRGVPLILQPVMNLLPHNHVIYKIPVGRDSYDLNDLFTDPLPDKGTGCVSVNHDYPTDENLTYENSDCCGVEGANILAFTKEDWDNGARSDSNAVATSQTTAGGRWAWDMLLDPGDYVIKFEKPGEYGPDTAELTVTDPGPPSVAEVKSSLSSSSKSSSKSSSSSEFGAF